MYFLPLIIQHSKSKLCRCIGHRSRCREYSGDNFCDLETWSRLNVKKPVFIDGVPSTAVTSSLLLLLTKTLANLS